MIRPCTNPKRPHGLGDIAASWLLFAGLLAFVMVGSAYGLEGLLSLAGSLVSLWASPARPRRSPS